MINRFQPAGRMSELHNDEAVIQKTEFFVFSLTAYRLGILYL